MIDKPMAVKIGANVYTITYQDETIHSPEGERIGEISYINRTITVVNQQCIVDMADTLLHEIIHAILEHFGYCDKKLKPEVVANLVSRGLIMVFVDNPDLLVWLSEQTSA